jgi:hypothetical protein
MAYSHSMPFHGDLTVSGTEKLYPLGFSVEVDDGTTGYAMYKYVYNVSTSAIAVGKSVSASPTVGSGTVNNFPYYVASGTVNGTQPAIGVMSFGSGTGQSNGTILGTSYGFVLVKGNIKDTTGTLYIPGTGTPGSYIIAGTAGTFTSATAATIGTGGSTSRPEFAVGAVLNGSYQLYFNFGANI